MTSFAPRQVIVHASDAADDVSRAVDTAGRLAESIDGVRVTVIVNGPALEGVSALTHEVPDAVEVSACAVGLQRRGIDSAALPPTVSIAASAAVAIVEAQLDGAAYMRL
ncbi:hypothetical protein [uncultured Agrococcus sp.]|uniref:hypothetical protein n=1 Tax=uncultured Agrococcus sp. TaxID=382258 RepID=UPI0025D423CC|nr:hypothetical protein [uncultured Agrococcus sp.]